MQGSNGRGNRNKMSGGKWSRLSDRRGHLQSVGRHCLTPRLTANVSFELN